MATNFPEGTHWFCVRTKPKKERMAAANVASILNLDVFCPLIRFRRKTVRGPVWFQEAMFPGYIFVRFDMMEMKQGVSYAPGILTIPMFNGRYLPVPDAVIQSLQDELDENGSVDAGIPLEVGEETTILEGSMRGLKVKVIKVMPAEDRVAVLLEMLGTLVEAEFPTDALEHRVKHRLESEK
ncbi:transcription termination/antitermination NusG family protein [Pontiellaceae bacterium B12219]|nr:transcription termination/antitermination NusG family protein [Pontiellaceae bacterium B12219]